MRRKQPPTFEEDPKAWLVGALSNKNSVIRRSALERLDSMGSAGSELLLELLRTEAQKKRKARRCTYWGLGIYFGIMLLIVTVWAGRGLFTGRWGDFPGEIFQFFTYFSFAGAAAAASMPQKDGTKWLAERSHPSHVGAFLDNLEITSDKETVEASVAGLTAALPKLTPEDAAMITPKQRETLRGKLKSAKRDFALAILGALPVMADTGSISAVEGFVHRLKAQKKRDAELLDRAIKSLAELQEMQEHVRLKETLLRPADAASENLLRPSESAPQVDPALLLRPTNTA